MEYLTREYKFKSHSGLCDIYAQSAAPSDFGSVRGLVQIAHGMAEHSSRYARFALELCKNGYAVFTNDHLGHGASVGSDKELGFFGDRGAESLVEDMKRLSDVARGEYPNLPLVLFGHSMGSFLARAYCAKYGATLAGAVYSGTSGANPAAGLGVWLAGQLEKKEGKLYRSSFLNSVAFGTYNKRTEKETEFDWLSRDKREVKKYMDDPWCGFVFTANGFKTLFSLLREVSKKTWYKAVPENLNILMISGGADPVGEYGRGVTQVYRDLKKSGHYDVALRLYPDARHELLNELNRDEVTEDILSWLNGICLQKPPQAAERGT